MKIEECLLSTLCIVDQGKTFILEFDWKELFAKKDFCKKRKITFTF